MKKTLLALGLAVLTLTAQAASSGPVSIAVLNFESPDEGIRDLGAKVTSLVSALLSAEPNLISVERAELDKLLGEQELGLSGTVNPETAAKVGQLTGAKVLVTGRVIKVEKELVLVAKVMGTETSRVFGEIVKGSTSTPVTDLAAALASKITTVVAQKEKELLAKSFTREDRVATIKGKLPPEIKAAVHVKIPEVHFGSRTIDPAAETELSLILRQCGFTLVDDKSDQKADYELFGEAFSEHGLRKGSLVSCKARVEIKLRRVSDGKLLTVDRQTVVAVDLSEQIAAKNALASAAATLAERAVPLLAVSGK